MLNIKTVEEMQTLAESTGLCGGSISAIDQSIDVEILYLSPTGARVLVDETEMNEQIRDVKHIVFSVDRFEEIRASIIWRQDNILGLQFDGASVVDASVASETTLAADDRRSYPRKRVMLTAELEIAQVNYSCRILDISLIGARLQVDEDLPDSDLMQLVTKRFGLLPVERMWRVADQLGVQFLEPAETINMILKDFLTE